MNSLQVPDTLEESYTSRLYNAVASLMANLIDAGLHRHEESGKVFADVSLVFDLLNERADLNAFSEAAWPITPESELHNSSEEA